MSVVSNNAPLVSVAMITYNHERFITKAIESVLAQRTSFPIELVIGDDASSDDTCQQIEVLKAQAPEVVRLLSRPTNIGMHRNIEGVLEECRGEFVAFLEGDDYWICEEKLQMQVDLLRARDDAVGVFHPAWEDSREMEGVFHPAPILDSLGRETAVWGPPESYTREIRTQEFLYALDGDVIGRALVPGWIPSASVMMRRDAIPDLPDSFRKLRMRDWPMWIFASLRGPWLCLPKVMAVYRMHDGGAWCGLSNAERYRGAAELLHTLAVELPQPFSAIAREQLVRAHLAAWEVALGYDRPADAQWELREVVRLLSYYRMRHGKRLASALLRTLSPRTHWIAKQVLRQIRQKPANNKSA